MDCNDSGLSAYGLCGRNEDDCNCSGGRKDGQEEKKIKGTLPDDGIRGYLYFAVIPVVVLILVVVILHSDKKKDAGQTEAVAMTAETGQPVGLNEGDPAVDESSAADSSKYTLKQDEMPELTALVQSYCQAKTDCDPEALQQLFGVTDLSEESDCRRAREDGAGKSQHQGVQEYFLLLYRRSGSGQLCDFSIF